MISVLQRAAASRVFGAGLDCRLSLLERHAGNSPSHGVGTIVYVHQWIRRHVNDPYVKASRKQELRSRAAFKLKEMQEKCRIMRPGDCVIDLGCAPGGWSQVVVQAIHPPSAPLSSSSLSGTSDTHVRAASNPPRSLLPPASGDGRVIGIDLRPMAPVPGVSFVLGDFSNAETQATLRQALGRDVGGDGMKLAEGMWKDGGGECEGTADVILSDMAPDLSGDKFRDHRRTLDLAYQVLAFADTVFASQEVRKNSALTKKQRRKTVLCKLFKGRDEEELLRHARSRYEDVRILKPKASRGESGEQYMLARGFKGRV